MSKLRRKVYMAAGYNTISLGTGRSEFNPKKPRPGIEHYIKEAGQATLSKIGGAKNVDEGAIGNFMASRFNKQGHLAGFIPYIDEELQYKPCTRTEGACASGALALMSGVKSVLAETADVVLSVGVEVQNTMKAIYGADVLAGAGWFQKRKNGHAYFFPGQFSDRAKAYYEKYGMDYARKGMKQWFVNAVENARLCPTAQEYENKVEDLGGLYDKMVPNGKAFVDSLNVLDCSKVSDGASAIAIMSEEGLERCGIPKNQAVQIVGFAQVERNITNDPPDKTELTAIKKDLSDWLYYNCRLTIQVHNELGIHQDPNERERDFKIRLQQAARERRDIEVDQLEEKFDKQISRLQDKLRKEERALAADEAEHAARKQQEMVGIGESVLDLALDRCSAA